MRKSAPPPAMAPITAARQPGGRNALQARPATMPGSGDDVRQDAVPQIDHEQHNHRAGKQEPHGEERRQSVQQHTAREHETRHELHERIGDADTGAAGAAAAAQQQPRHDRHVLVPRQWTLALRAVRRRPRDRLPARQPVDADIEKAAHQQAQPEQRDRGAEHGHRPGLSIGSGLSVDCGFRETLPDAGSSSKANRSGSAGTPRKPTSAQFRGWPPGLSGIGVDEAVQVINLVHRGRAGAAGRSLVAPSTLRATAPGSLPTTCGTSGDHHPVLRSRRRAAPSSSATQESPRHV